MADDVVKRAGRIVYVEPNNINNLHPTNAIPYNYEDYSVSVNLRVFRHNRYTCGQPENFDSLSDVLGFSSEKGTISFIGGSNGYLSTNFTDISMNDPMTNTHECLGIESINIAFNSWYFPNVDIKFVDVRGASLMLPAEHENYNNSDPNYKADSKGHFFDSLFTFPYPLFKLSVKGFYGKEITYDLTVSDVKISFNSNTGNFEAIVKFIGYMYGVYTEIPMNLISVAPYIEYGEKGKAYWENEKDAGHFVFKEGNAIDAQMLTFPELNSTVSDASMSAQKLAKDSVEGRRYKTLSTLTKKLNEVNMAYKSFRNLWYFYRDASGQGFFYLPLDGTEDGKFEKNVDKERDIIVKVGNYSKKIEDYNNAAQEKGEVTIQTLQNEKQISSIAKDYNEQLKVVNGNDEKVDFAKISRDNISYVTFTTSKDKTDSGKTIIDTIETEGNRHIAANAGNFSTLIDFIKNGDKNVNEKDTKNSNKLRNRLTGTNAPKYCRVYFIRVNRDNLNKESDGIGERFTKESDKLREKLKLIKRQSMRDGLGFNPTIRNMFNLVFAHTNTFIEAFYACLNEIRKQIIGEKENNRYISNFVGPDKNVLCDINETYIKNHEKNGSLPPFTCFYVEKTNKSSQNGNDKNVEVIWPGNLPGGESLEEVKFVRAIVAATVMYKESLPKKVNNNTVDKKTNRINPDVTFYPLTLYDFMNPYENAYSNVLGKYLNKEDVLDRILFVFSLRCFYFFLMNGNNDNDENFKLFGLAESENVIKAIERAHNKCSTSLKNELLRTGNNLVGYIEKYLTENIFANGTEYIPKKYRGAIFNRGAQDSSPIIFRWNGSKNYLPIGSFNINSICSSFENNGQKDSKKFVNVLNLTDNTQSFNILSEGTFIEDLQRMVYTDNDTGKSFKPLFSNFDTNITNILSGIEENGYGAGALLKTNQTDYTIEDFAKKTTFKELREKYVSDYKSGAYFVTTPSIIITAVDANTSTISLLFGHPIYNNQNNRSDYTLGKLARAYLFLMGVPVVGENPLLDTAISATVPKIYLLREGAMYWRRKYMEENDDDPIITDSFIEETPRKAYKNPTKDESYLVKSGGAVDSTYLCPIPVNDNVHKYLEFKEPKGTTKSRINKLIEYFEEWAKSSEFTNIDYALTLKVEDKQDGKVSGPLRVATEKELLTFDSGSFKDNGVYSSFGEANQIQRIRTGLKYKGKPDENSTSVFEKCYESLNTLFCDFETTIDFAVPYDNDNSTVSYNAMKTSMNEFVTNLKEKLGKVETKEEEDVSIITSQEDPYQNEDLFKSVYELLRNLYNKWFCSNSKDTWAFNAMATEDEMMESDFGKFRYMDNFYHDIGDRLLVNMQTLANTFNMFTTEGAVNTVFSEKSNEMSVYRCLAGMCQKNGMTLMALPSMFGLTFSEDGENLADMFRPIPFNDAKRMNSHNSVYVALYTYKPSEFLNIESDSGEYAYQNDGCDIADSRGNILSPVPASFSDGDEKSMLVPAFGVTFAKQNQSYFKNIQLSMNDHQQTAPAMQATLSIAAQGSKSPRTALIFGQDLYNVYSNYSYSCTVDMMGNAQVLPLMYFQLNNIPMWKGLYMIVNVTHTINGNGQMNTQFKGVRINKYTMPIVEPDIIYMDDDYPSVDEKEFQEGVSGDGNTVKTTKGNDASKNNTVSSAENYARTHKKITQAGGKTVSGGNIYTPIPSTNLFDEGYLASHGWNASPEKDIIDKLNGSVLADGKETTLKFLIVHNTDMTMESFKSYGSSAMRPPYNVYIDAEGNIHYLWYTPDEKNNKKCTIHHKCWTNGSDNYDLCSINLAFYGTMSDGKINISDATKRTLHTYLCVFADRHNNDSHTVKIIGYNQIAYGPNETKPDSPGFSMPKMLDSLKDKAPKKKMGCLAKSIIYTDPENVIQIKDGDRKYIDADNYFYILNVKEEKDGKKIGEWKRYQEPGSSKSGVR